jgi:diguanylate cyclase (GGDEF)-like protein/PAS domain S-box-containing protein
MLTAQGQDLLLVMLGAATGRFTDGLTSQICLGCLALLLASLWALDRSRRRATRRRQEQAHLYNLADLAVEGLIVCDGTAILIANDRFAGMVGIDREVLRGMTLDSLFERPEAPDRTGSLPERDGDQLVVSSRGERIPVEVVRKSILHAGKPHQVLAVRDLRERRRAEEEIRFLAHHDALTGLANRASFTTGLTQALRDKAHDQPNLAVLALDLDRFKEVNDMLGHQAGDLLLKRVANRLRSILRDSDCIARLGGDEFAVLLPGPTNVERAVALAERIVEVIRRPYLLEGKVVRVGVSVGVAVAPEDGDKPAALMKNADMALYRAKSDGRNTSRHYDPAMDVELQNRLSLEADLRRALSHGQLEMQYQPLFDIQSQSVRGFEALIRWRHPTKGLISPAGFIPLAEETGLIIPIGEFVLNASTSQAAQWDEHITVSVNLSAVQFSGGKLVEMVGAALARSGLAPHRLELEITETVLLHDSAETLRTLHQLRALGVRIAMDDFGTGYSSLQYLRSFPFDRIKIDRSFIREMLSNNESAAIISAVVALSQRLGIMTTAEGVETEEQMARIQAEGCNTVQGFWIGRPAPATEVARYLDHCVEEVA